VGGSGGDGPATGGLDPPFIELILKDLRNVTMSDPLLRGSQFYPECLDHPPSCRSGKK
jgi:hypothetical protein